MIECHKENQCREFSIWSVAGRWFLKQEGLSSREGTKKAEVRKGKKWVPQTTWRGAIGFKQFPSGGDL